jgi:hypothetical protein
MRPSRVGPIALLSSGDLIVSELFTAVAADFLARYGPGGAQLDPGTELFAIFGVGYIT